MENTIASNRQQTISRNTTRSVSTWSSKLSLLTLIAALGVLAISIELQIPAVVAFYEEMLQQLDVLEQLLENPALMIGYK